MEQLVDDGHDHDEICSNMLSNEDLCKHLMLADDEPLALVCH